MGEPLTAEDFNSLFRYFRHTAFRLETQAVYTVEEEQPSFRRFLAGNDDAFEEYPLFAAWLEQIRALTHEGKRVERVRIVDEPPTEYQRWEFRCGKANIAAGEHIGYLPRGEARRLAIPDTVDWWLFDGQRLARMGFDAEGIPLGGVIVDDPGVVAQHRAWQDLANRHAVPASEYQPPVAIETRDSPD